jgi:predicted unusual protein kinase regulating ubiquinone biosynthesis (AarF/ABC1/UbiB family)
MRAAIRLLLASALFTRILVSYLTQLGWARLVGPARARRRWAVVHQRNARRLYRGFVRLRGVYIKLGQVLSIMGNFLPRAYARELEKLQDEVPPRPYRIIARALSRALGLSPARAFQSFDETPIAAASLGQVHRAVTHDGRRVAVKVLYPDIATIIAVDLRVLHWVLRVYQYFVPVQQLERVHAQLTEMLARETDYRHEATALARMARNFQGDPDICIPEVVESLSRTEVLTMTFMEGVKISRTEELEALGIDRAEVARKLLQAFYRQILVHRFFHADPHPGNLLVRKNPQGRVELVLLDFGATTEVPAPLIEGLGELLRGIALRQDQLVVRGIHTMGFVADHGDTALLERTVRTYFEKLLGLNFSDMGQLSSQVARELAASTERRNQLRHLMRAIQYPHGWFFVERTALLLFSLSAHLSPELNPLHQAIPFVMRRPSAPRAAVPPTSTTTVPVV